MIPWTSSTHNFHFVAAFWFTHAAVSYASTVSLPQLCVCLTFWSLIHPHLFNQKARIHEGAGWLNSFTPSLNHWSPEHWDWKLELKHDKGWKHCKLQMRPGDPWLPSQMSLMCSASPLHSSRFHREMAGFPVSDGRQVYDRARNEKPKAAHQNPSLKSGFTFPDMSLFLPWLSIIMLMDYTDIKLQFTVSLWFW